jgi:MFS family permease
MANDGTRGRALRPIWLSLPRLTSSFLNAAFVIIALPIVVLTYASPDQEGLQLGLLSALSVVLTIIILMGVAFVSDSLPGSRRRRKPFVLAGHLLVLPAAALLILGYSYFVLVTAILVMVASRSAIDSAHLPLINDLVSMRERGRYSALVSLMGVVGAAGGAILAGYLAQEAEKSWSALSFLGPLSLGALGLALVAGMLFAVYVHEPPREASPSGLWQLIREWGGRRERTYYRFMFARTIYLVGIFAVLIFFVYLVKDVYLAADYKLMSGIYYAAAAIGAAAFTVPAGALSDRFGCLPVIYGCGIAQAASCAVVFLLGYVHPVFAVGGALLFGASFGGMFASSLALSTKLIPRAGDTAKYMALLVVSTYAAQLVASLTAGPGLDIFNRLSSGSGYTALFIYAVVCFLGGAAILLKIKEPKSGPGGTAVER